MGPDASLVSGLVAELVAHLEEDTDTPALISAAMAHLNLVMIHPFRDGNGRMARCMQTLVLARERVIAQEYSSIEEYLGKETPSYYEILANVGQGRWSPRGDARPWVQFCLKAHFVQMMTVHRIVSETEEMWRQLVDVAKTNRIPDRALVILLRATRGLKIKNSSYRAALRAADEEISIPTATSDLAAMVRAGLLVQHGIKRGAYYEAGKPLLKIRHAFLESRTPIDTSDLFTSQGDLFTTSAATTAGTIWPPQLSWQSQTAGRGGA
jgi:Fic family protein